MTLNEFKQKSDVIIYNDKDYQYLELQLDNIMREAKKYKKNDIIFIY